jgi:drug/metabolite transporter (DMT)-like permease
VRHSNLRAIVTMLAAVAFFSLLDAGLKHLTQDYAPIEVMFLRAAASLPFLGLAILGTGNWRALKAHRPHLYLIRGALGILVLWTFIYAVSVQSLSYTYAIYMSAPLMVAALSGPLLGERVPARRWAAILAGLIGVVIALKPSGQFVALGALAAALSAACYAFNVMAVRLIGRTDSTYAVVFWHLLLVMIVAGTLAWPQWRPIQAASWGWIALCGLTGALGQFLFTAAFRLAPASTIAPFEYTAMLWGIALDWLVFAAVPHLRVLVGGTIVICGGLYVIWDERRSAQTHMPVIPAG